MDIRSGSSPNRGGVTIHKHLPKIPKLERKLMGWGKAVELVKVARRDREQFDCATLHRTVPMQLRARGVWTAEYQTLEEARTSIARRIEEYNHDQPHRGVANRTLHESFLAFTAVLDSEMLTV
jgi:hypothetical protein